MIGRGGRERRTPAARRITRRAFLKAGGVAGVTAAASGWQLQPLLSPQITVGASPVTLNYWTGYPEIEPFIKKAAEEYAKTHPGFRLETLSSTLREMEAKVSAAIPADSGPDIFDISRTITIGLSDADLLPPNPPKVAAFVKSGVYDQAVVDWITWKGKTYGIPMMDGGRENLYYNTKMFTEAGLDPNKPPATFDELMAAARKLAKYDSSKNLIRSGLSLRLSGQGSGVADKFDFIAYAYGGYTIVQTKAGKWHNGYDNEAGRQALKFYIDAVHKYHVDDPKLRHDADAFVSQQTAMLMRESWVIGELKTKGPDVQYNTAPIPRAKRWGANTWPYCIYVTRTSKSPDIAWDFAQFMVSPAMQVELIKTSGWTAIRKDVDWGPILRETPQYKAFLVWPKGRGFFEEPPVPAFVEVQSKMADRLVAAYMDKSLVDNPDGIAKTIHATAVETDNILKKAGVYGAD